MKSYLCRAAPYEDWIAVCAYQPDAAAETYAEEHGLESGDIISVWGVGKFEVEHVYHEPVVHVRRLGG